MLFHKTCKMPVEVLNDEVQDHDTTLTLLRFYCTVCKTEILDDSLLEVHDTITELEALRSGL